MDIESNRFRIVKRNDGTHTATVYDKGPSGRMLIIPADHVPSVEYLAALNESDFDSTVRGLIYDE